MRKFFSSNAIGLESLLFGLRVVIGVFLIYHGWEVFDRKTMTGYFDWESFKGFSSPEVMVYIGKGSELLAGVLLTLGLFTRVGALITIVTLSYIAFKVGNGKIWYEDQYPFLFVLFGILYLFAGGGRYSLDALLFSNKRRW